jgi:hypothetical protein
LISLIILGEEHKLWDSSLCTQNYWVFGLFPSSSILENRKNNVLEPGSVSILRLVGGRHLFSCIPQKQPTSITGQPMSDSHSYLITWDNKKICKKLW